jgi:ATP phosphoribosyltransferase
VANHAAISNPAKRADLERLVMRIKAVQSGRQYKYVMMNAPRRALPEIRQILPGLRDPTVVDLADPEWVAVHAAVREEVFWDVIEGLHKAGASEILVAPIEKLVK